MRPIDVDDFPYCYMTQLEFDLGRSSGGFDGHSLAVFAIAVDRSINDQLVLAGKFITCTVLPDVEGDDSHDSNWFCVEVICSR